MSNDDVSNAGFWKRKRKRKRLAVSATSKFMGGIATSKITAVWGKRKRKRGWEFWWKRKRKRLEKNFEIGSGSGSGRILRA